MTKLIIGLGNPGPKYASTRHNIGWMALDALAKTNKLKWHTSKTAKIEYTWLNGDTELIKPQTYMNNSGFAVAKIVKKHALQPSDILVVSDDIDLELGKLRQRDSGSSGGHNGIQSIIDHLGSTDFRRLKIGISRPPQNVDPSDYVLQPFTKAQLTKLEPALKKAVDLLLKEL